MSGPTPERIYLVGCCGSKLPHAAPAQDLYTSPLFRAASRYARARCDLEGALWAILSARGGLYLPEDRVEPYDVPLRGRGRDDRRAYAFRVSTSLRPRGWHRAELVALAGRAYVDPLRELFPDLCILEPMRGLGVGERLHWLAEQTYATRLEIEASCVHDEPPWLGRTAEIYPG